MNRKKPDVLVLNKSYVAIHIVDWKKAMSLICQDSARPMDRDFVSYSFADWMLFSDTNKNDYPTAGTVNRKIAIPEIIVLRKYDKLPSRDVKYSRQTLFERDHFTCGYCGKIFDKKELTVDHIVPRSQGGTTTWKNTITACFPCNSTKADKTPEQAKMKLKFKPGKPVWFSPLNDIKPDHPCKSWVHFSGRTLVD
jgi:5-methylcytosine-specific restriction endonuclease McrA